MFVIIAQKSGTNQIKARPEAEKNIAVEVTLDGTIHELKISDEDLLLDALIAEGLDVPYFCKAGVCSTCRCKIFEGEVEMEKNFTLPEEAVAEGYALSCQSRIKSNRIVMSYDER